MRLATGLHPDPLGELKRSQSPAVQGKERRGKEREGTGRGKGELGEYGKRRERWEGTRAWFSVLYWHKP